MKKGIKSIFLILFGLCIGHLINHFRLASANFTEFFWIGVLACICIGFVLISIELRILKSRNKQFLLATYFIGILFIAVTLATVIIYQLNKQHAEENIKLEENIQKQEHINNSTIEINKIDLVNLLLKEISEEVKLNSKRTLSPNMLKKIIQLSNSLYPFYYYTQDTLSNKKLSPGRGQLLLGLSYLDIDSSNFSYLIQRADFSYSLLKDVDLSGLLLNGINLKNSLIVNSNFNSTSLENSEFENSYIINSTFNNSILRNSSFKLSHLEWNNFYSSILTNSDFNGISGYNNYFNKTILSKSSFQWSNLESNQFILSDLKESDFWGANLTRANFSEADLKNSRLLDCKLTQTNFSKSNLINSAVNHDWLKKARGVTNPEEIKAKYSVRRDSSARFKRQDYFIKSK